MLPNGCVGTIVPSKSVKGTVYTGMTICGFVVCLYACVCVCGSIGQRMLANRRQRQSTMRVAKCRYKQGKECVRSREVTCCDILRTRTLKGCL